MELNDRPDPVLADSFEPPRESPHVNELLPYNQSIRHGGKGSDAIVVVGIDRLGRTVTPQKSRPRSEKRDIVLRSLRQGIDQINATARMVGRCPGQPC